MDPSFAPTASDTDSHHRKRIHFNASIIPGHVNREIENRYSIDQKIIGSGGYGQVFIGQDKILGDREVAIKRVRADCPETRQALQKEAVVMKSLDHPNICKLLETYDTDECMYFVMEYCSGGDVYDELAANGPIAESVTADIVRQTASAVSYANKKGIAHRDLKPENIVLCEGYPNDTQIKVIDWGLSFYFGNGGGLARMTSRVGSMLYAAPEVLKSKQGARKGYTAACDIWSLGVVAYIMLSGQVPFTGEHRNQLRKMDEEEFLMKGAKWSHISAEAKDFIRRSLKAVPNKRMSIGGVLDHPWLKHNKPSRNPPAAKVLMNLQEFTNRPTLFSFCAASMARQLDHRSLRDIQQVFCQLDSNGDGVLQLQEIEAGFHKIFGPDSEEAKNAKEVFKKLDFDGSGSIDYTEFCAAGIGVHRTTQEDLLWAAFKGFDDDDNGEICTEEIRKVLHNADIEHAWSIEQCDKLSQEIITEFDVNGDGIVDFKEFSQLMRSVADPCPGVKDGSGIEKYFHVMHNTSRNNLAQPKLRSQLSCAFNKRPATRVSKSYTPTCTTCTVM